MLYACNSRKCRLLRFSVLFPIFTDWKFYVMDICAIDMYDFDYN